MDRELRRLRTKIADTAKDTKGHRRFAAELRSEIVSFARTRIAAGATLRSTAAELELATRVLWGWLQTEPSSPLREVVVDGDEAVVGRSDRRIVLRGGVEIVGLELDELIEIARALS